MIIVAGKLYVDPDARDRYLDRCRVVLELARAAPGCHDFVVSGDALEDGRVNVYERWETDADVERFRGDGPEQEQQAEIRSADVARYQISSVGPA